MSIWSHQRLVCGLFSFFCALFLLPRSLALSRFVLTGSEMSSASSARHAPVVEVTPFDPERLTPEMSDALPGGGSGVAMASLQGSSYIRVLEGKGTAYRSGDQHLLCVPVRRSLLVSECGPLSIVKVRRRHFLLPPLSSFTSFVVVPKLLYNHSSYSQYPRS